MMFRFSAATLLVFILACGGLEIGGGQPSKPICSGNSEKQGRILGLCAAGRLRPSYP